VAAAESVKAQQVPTGIEATAAEVQLISGIDASGFDESVL
jgi:hypothetical protein